MKQVAPIRVLVPALLLTSAASSQDIVGHWRLEGRRPGAAVRLRGMTVEGIAEWSASVPGAYVYDPVAGVSRKNGTSLALG